MAYIQSFGLAIPPYANAQKDIGVFIQNMYQLSEPDAEKMFRMYDRSEIATRYSVIKDFSSPINEWTFFHPNEPTSIEKRMQTFFQLAPQLAVEAIKKCISNDDLQSVTHLITVSCTGMSAPGLDIQLLQLLKLPANIHRTSINFMGCYAAIHALKQANDICRSIQDAKVLIIDIELCTLHFQPNFTPDNMAASLLFADGAAAVLVSNEEGIFQIDDFYSEVAIQGYSDMAWDISSTGFQMTLSNYIPSIIAENIEPLLQRSLQKMNLTQQDIQHWAIHPGGKKIILEIANVFHLNEDDIAVSKSILRNFGNMSSVTILFVLEEMARKIKQKNERVYAVAFGPGLTIETMFLSSC